jgi:hypothetical protein
MVFNCLSKDVNSLLLKKILGLNILGIRFDVEIPTEFQGHFRYKDKFNLLTAPFSLTWKLAKWLHSLWLKTPYNLWLHRSVSYRIFLRELPIKLKQFTGKIKASPAVSVEFSEGSLTEDYEPEFDDVSQSSNEDFDAYYYNL